MEEAEEHGFRNGENCDNYKSGLTTYADGLKKQVYTRLLPELSGLQEEKNIGETELDKYNEDGAKADNDKLSPSKIENEKIRIKSSIKELSERNNELETDLTRAKKALARTESKRGVNIGLVESIIIMMIVLLVLIGIDVPISYSVLRLRVGLDSFNAYAAAGAASVYLAVSSHTTALSITRKNWVMLGFWLLSSGSIMAAIITLRFGFDPYAQNSAALLVGFFVGGVLTSLNYYRSTQHRKALREYRSIVASIRTNTVRIETLNNRLQVLASIFDGESLTDVRSFESSLKSELNIATVEIAILTAQKKVVDDYFDSLVRFGHRRIENAFDKAKSDFYNETKDEK